MGHAKDGRVWLDTARRVEASGFSTLIVPGTMQTRPPSEYAGDLADELEFSIK